MYSLSQLGTAYLSGLYVKESQKSRRLAAEILRVSPSIVTILISKELRYI